MILAKRFIKMPTENLARREIEVMTLTAIGKTRPEISQVLHLSKETVKDYIARSCRKLHAVNKTHAVALAVTLGLITPFKRRTPKDTAK
jgi:LuxR family transcriptional regulator, quorum-sensing system regulator BjaR1